MRILGHAFVFLMLIVVAYLFGVREESSAQLQISVSDYKHASLCMHVVEGDDQLWPHLSVTLATHSARLTGDGTVLAAIEPETDKMLIDSGLKGSAVSLDSLVLSSGSTLAVGRASVAGESILISLVAPTDAETEGVPSVEMIGYSSDTGCDPPHTGANGGDGLSTTYDASVASFGQEAALATFEASGGDAEKLQDALGDKIAISDVASTLGGGAAVVGIVPPQLQGGIGLFSLPIRLSDAPKDSAGVTFAALNDPEASVNVSGAAVIDSVIGGLVRGELVVNGEQAIILSESDLVSFTTQRRAEHSRWLSMDAAGDIVMSAPVTAVAVSDMSQMPSRTDILEDWVSNVFWWIAFGYLGFLVGRIISHEAGKREWR